MACEQFRLALDEIGEMLLQHCSGAGMQFLATGAQQGTVGGVLHQRVLEQIGRMRRRAAAEQQAGLGQSCERSLQIGDDALGHRFDPFVSELAA